MSNAGHNDPKFAAEPEDVKAAFVTDDGDDTDGHRMVKVTDDDTIPNAPEGVRARVTDEGDDTEGHRIAAF